MKLTLAAILSLFLIACAETVYQQPNTIPYCTHEKCQIRITHRYDSDMTEDYQAQFKISTSGAKVCMCLVY